MAMEASTHHKGRLSCGCDINSYLHGYHDRTYQTDANSHLSPAQLQFVASADLVDVLEIDSDSATTANERREFVMMSHTYVHTMSDGRRECLQIHRWYTRRDCHEWVHVEG